MGSDLQVTDGVLGRHLRPLSKPGSNARAVRGRHRTKSPLSASPSLMSWQTNSCASTGVSSSRSVHGMRSRSYWSNGSPHQLGACAGSIASRAACSQRRGFRLTTASSNAPATSSSSFSGSHRTMTPLRNSTSTKPVWSDHCTRQCGSWSAGSGPETGRIRIRSWEGSRQSAQQERGAVLREE